MENKKKGILSSKKKPAPLEKDVNCPRRLAVNELHECFSCVEDLVSGFGYLKVVNHLKNNRGLRFEIIVDWKKVNNELTDLRNENKKNGK